MGSIPTRSRHWVLLAALLAAPRLGRAQQQDSARAGIARPTPPPDEPSPEPLPKSTGALVQQPLARPRVRAPVSPTRAFLYSLALPGLGQAKLDRAYAGALFFSVEAVAFEMLRQAQIDLRYAQTHLHDSTLVVQSYQTDSLGRPLRDSTGKPIPASYAYSRYDSALVGARKTHVEDWIAVILFNHLISGADAFVAAQLWDLPAHVHPITGETPDKRRIYGLSVDF